jgi:hypothetical protein
MWQTLKVMAIFLLAVLALWAMQVAVQRTHQTPFSLNDGR